MPVLPLWYKLATVGVVCRYCGTLCGCTLFSIISCWLTLLTRSIMHTTPTVDRIIETRRRPRLYRNARMSEENKLKPNIKTADWVGRLWLSDRCGTANTSCPDSVCSQVKPRQLVDISVAIIMLPAAGRHSVIARSVRLSVPRRSCLGYSAIYPSVRPSV